MNELFDILNRIAAKLDVISDKLNKNALPTTQSDKMFGDFALYYFERFRWRKVCVETKRVDLCRYNAHIAPMLAEMRLADITPEHVQKVVDGLHDRQKTAHEVFTLINVVCKAAIKHNIIAHNPCDLVLLQPYESKHGKALSKDDERLLLAKTSGTAYQLMFAVAIYTGLRPNEYKTARIDNGFIVARNSKQHDGKEHTKRIPITPMLAPYINNAYPDEPQKVKFYHTNRLRDKLLEILPKRKLYDMRTTFYTRCQECGVSEIARNLFVGHSLGGLADTYTDISDEYLITEAQKLNY